MRASLPFASLIALCCLFVPVVASAAGVEVEQATKDQLAAAQTTFQAANKLFDAGRYEEAITAFRASYDIVRSPNSVLMVARCQRELGRLGKAFASYTRALTDAERVAKTDPKYKETADAAREELGQLRNKVALLTISVTGAESGSEVRVAERRIPVDALGDAIPLKPGEYDISARAASGKLVTRHVSLTAGSEQKLDLDLSDAQSSPVSETAPEPSSPPASARATVSTDSGSSARTFAYVSGGVGVLGMAAFGAFGLMSNSKYSSLKSSCPGGTCPPGTQSDIDNGKKFQTFANVGLVVGAVGLGVGITLFALSGNSQEETARGSTTEVAILPDTVAVRGTF